MYICIKSISSIIFCTNNVLWFNKKQRLPEPSRLVCLCLMFSFGHQQIVSILGVLFGIITTGLAFATGYFGPTVIQIILSLSGLVVGSVLGLFVVGIHLPWTNSMVNTSLV